MKSASGEFNGQDFVKAIGVFMWNLGSLLTAVFIAILTIPHDQLPEWLFWVVPLAPTLNAIAYAIQRWLQDNRK
jgi:hypothetical protein